MAPEPETPRPSIGVVMVDDQEAFRRAARDVIEAANGFELLGEAASGEEALALVDEVAPDLVIVDVRMPGLDGFETARRMRDARPSATVVLVSSEDVTVESCASSGAAAFLPKEAFCPAELRRLWDEHGRQSGFTRPG